MHISRRNLLTGLSGMAATAAFGQQLKQSVGSRGPAMGFPRKEDFAIADDYTYLNGAYTHPMPSFAYVLSGEITVEDKQGNKRHFTKG